VCTHDKQTPFIRVVRTEKFILSFHYFSLAIELGMGKGSKKKPMTKKERAEKRKKRKEKRSKK
jgi:hypothetical protein